MKTPKLKIIARLNPNEGGCNYSKHFTQQWLNNPKLHPFAKAIPVQVKHITATRPSIQLLANGNIVLHQTGNAINPATLQEFILKNYLK